MSKSKKKEATFNEEFSCERSNNGNVLGICFKDNPEQRELIRLINMNNLPVVYCFGDAGTGKTFTTIAAAIHLVKIQKKYRQIFYIREPIEVGKSLGFLPGDLGDKYGVYLDGLNDNLKAISEMTGLNINDMKTIIECTPPQYTRGRSFPAGSLIIIDEAQNLELNTIQTLMTRMGKFSKIIMLGSLKQIDLKGKTKDNNDFLISYNILSEIPEQIVGRVDLIKSERSEYCKLLDDAFTNYKERKIKLKEALI